MNIYTKSKLVSVKTLVMAVLLLGLSACSDESDDSSAAATEQTSAKFVDYLNYKRLIPADDQERKALRAQFDKRHILAEKIENSGKLDLSRVNAEVSALRRQILISRYFDQYISEQVTAETIQQYYVAHADEFEAKKVRVAHILIRVSSDLSDETVKVKETTIQAARAQLLKGRDFAEVVIEYSEDKNSLNQGGVIGWLAENAIDPIFSETMFALKPGSVSEPVRTRHGWHIIKLLEGPVLVKRPLESVSGDIRYRLRTQAKTQETQRLLSLTEK